ncbi:hydrocephalus-inducing protein homolog isoform X2 [Haemorhous mexicanus]|uniref:hydrocephalus-inducing protein homolog isoform X2 n=1 Tax=Haemorhous mexicanus TaxID=30427 RepID=UPI0028BE9654|nr:hydrocephalus-inducing protein homolog isoform X2 [Haemorhous mexicanus]
MSPAIGILDAGDTMQVTVGFHLLTTGDHCGSLAVCCSTGEENIHTNLRGDAVEINVGLSTNSVELEKTFITMSSHKTMFIENRSNITAHLQWKAFPTEEGEIEEKRRVLDSGLWKRATPTPTGPQHHHHHQPLLVFWMPSSLWMPATFDPWKQI